MRARAAVALLAVSLAGCKAKETPPPARVDAGPGLVDVLVPGITGPVACDGKLTEPDWLRATRTGAFATRGGAEPARPLSEARLLHDDRFLYLALYAADEDIRPAAAAHDGPVWTGDSFSVRVFHPAEVRVDLSASGTVTDAKVGPPVDPTWESGVVAGIDMDGTANDDRDDDEEWTVEAAIPIASLCGGAVCKEVVLELSRCDTPRGGRRSCASWGGKSTRIRLE